MKGYIYKLYAGADASVGWQLNDPIFGENSTLGACVPNIRRNVEVGDWVFALSGRVPETVPYIVGGFKVDEKIDALEAHSRFPEYRLSRNERGQIIGNIIVDSKGEHHPLDSHPNFQMRRSNYLVGRSKIFAENDDEIAALRERTHSIVERIFDKKSNRLFDIVGRWRRLNETQVSSMLEEIGRTLDR